MLSELVEGERREGKQGEHGALAESRTHQEKRTVKGHSKRVGCMG